MKENLNQLKNACNQIYMTKEEKIKELVRLNKDYKEYKGFLAEEITSLVNFLGTRKRIKTIRKNNGREGIVYFLSDGFNSIKIGFCQDMRTRLMQLQLCNPNKLTLLHIEYGNEKLESIYHNKYKEYHIRGEWFKYEGKLKEYIENIK